MPLLTSTTLIRTLSLFHLSLSYLLLTSPTTIADQNLVFIFSEAMRLPHPDPSLSTPTTTTALLSALLFLSSLTDLTALSLPPEAAAQHWGAQAPVRLLFFFGVLGYVYLFKEGGVFGAATAGKGGKGWGAELRNGVVFTWAFLEMMGWFWVYIKLSDERREAAVRVLERRRAEEEGML